MQSLLGELKANPSGTGLQHQANDAVAAVGSSISTTGSIDVATVIRASIPHFVKLVGDQDIHELVRLSPVLPKYGDSHLVALGPNGFFFCSCLMLLTKGLPCRHGIKALDGREVGFNGACVARRWWDSVTPWTMEALATKSVELASTSEGSSVGQHPTDDTCTGISTSGKENVGATVYANSVAFGKELTELTRELKTTAGCDRLLCYLKNAAKDYIKVEVYGQNKKWDIWEF